MASDQGPVKRASDDGNDVASNSKRQRLEELHADVRILIASRNAGAVIGKGGDVIKRLREQYQCTISLPDSQGAERILNISGQAANICEVIREIIPKFDKERDITEEEVRLLIHQNLAGRVIGKQGIKVKELKEVSGAQIKVYTECCPESGERVVQMMGNADQIATCTGLILDLLSDAVQRGPTIPYNPEYADESFATEYGGYVDSRRRGRGGFRGGMSRGGGGAYGGGMSRGRGSGYDGGRAGRGGYGQSGSFGGDMYGGDVYGAGAGGGYGGGFGGMSSNYGGGGGYGMGRGNMGGGDGPVQTSNVSIPKNVAGAILGRGGSRMRQIQMDSCTKIKMEQADVEGDERVISIVGTPEQIKYAQYLLQQAVKQHGTMGARGSSF